MPTAYGTWEQFHHRVRDLRRKASGDAYAATYSDGSDEEARAWYVLHFGNLVQRTDNTISVATQLQVRR